MKIRRTNLLVRTAALALLLGVLIAPVQSTLAQESVSLQVRDGEVYINGRAIPEDELPPSLNLDGLQIQYHFSGDVEPVIRLGSDYFVLEEGRLREAEPHELSDVSVIVRQDEPHAIQLSAANARLAEAAARNLAMSADEHLIVLQQKAAELQAHAEHIKQLQTNTVASFSDVNREELEQAARELTVRAEEAARMAEEMPRLHVQRYFDRIQRNDHVLFERLVDERQMEGETLRLAAEIRQLDEGAVREQKIEELRARLDEIFNLKQENRRKEIEQLEERLEDLRLRLRERERMRAEIIDRRLRELLHRSESVNW